MGIIDLYLFSQGIESRTVYCMDYNGREVDSRACSGPKPDTERMCNVGSPRNTGKWKTGKWSEVGYNFL